MPLAASSPSAQQASQVQQLREALEELRREHELFAGRIAHDLHTVLHNIAGFAGALRRHGEFSLDERGRHFLNRVQENAARGSGLVQSLLEFEQLARARVTWGSVDLRALVERATAEAAEQHPGVAVTWRLEGAMPTLHGDANLLQRALHGLLSNALRFRRDDRACEVSIAGQVQGEALKLQVSDNGIGFPACEAHRLFQPFQRLHSGHAREGAGMGLACVRRIVERHGGSVAADPLAGGGAVFTLVLPLWRPGGASDGTAADAAGSPSRRVLLIDDDPLVLASVRAMLERCGHAVSAASGGLKGLHAFEHGLRSLSFDVVVTDWGMPQVDGGRVLQAVRGISPATPVVVITGRPAAELDACRDQVDVVLAKPLRRNTLRAAIEQACTARPARLQSSNALAE